MASLAALRKQAKDAGISKAKILAATTPEELQSLISDSNDHDERPRKKTAVAKKKTAVAKKKSGNSAERKQTGRKNTAQKKSGRNSTPAKSRKSGTAKRSGTAKAKNTGGYVPKGGRNLLDSLDFSETDGWNPREGSAPALIIAAVRKARGNRQKAFETLKGDLWNFVGKKKADGTKRTKAEGEAMLKYRISRTLWDFAVKTGQHEAATNRVQYGTGGTGEGVWKPAKRTSGKQATRKPAKAQKSAQGRRGASVKKKTTKKKSGSRR